MFNAIYSEWIKARSIKSTPIISIISFGLFVGIAGMYGWYKNNDYVVSSELGNPNVTSALIWTIATEIGATFSIIALLVFAVLSITSEYNFNTISTSLLATPNRMKSFLAKNIFVSLFIAINLIISLIVAFFVTYLFTGDMRSGMGWSFEKCWFDDFNNLFLLRILGFVLMGLFATSIGYIIKNSAAALVIVMVVITNFISGVLAIINMFIKQDFIAYISLLMPDKLIQELSATNSESLNVLVHDSKGGHYVEAFSNFNAGITLALIVGVCLLIAMICFKKRDV